MKEKKLTLKEKLIMSLKILAGLLFISMTISMFFGFDTEIVGGNIAVIPIHGVITVEENAGFGSDVSASDNVIESLKKADENPNIKAILLDINSPGGSPVATDEISQKIKSINKTKVAVIRETGASGAYWIATSADYIFANRLSIVGSIGVIGSYLDFSGFLTRYNVTYQRYVSGNLKDMGSPFKEPEEEERRVMQQLIDKMQVFFVEEVALNRNMSIDRVNKLATGEVFLGSEAKKLGLVDALGTRQDAINYIENKLNITARPIEYKEKKSFSELLAEFSSYFKPGIGKFINPASNNVQFI